MGICFQGGFAVNSNSSLFRKLLFDPSCERFTDGESELIICGKMLNTRELCERFNIEFRNTTSLLDVFLSHPVEKVLPHLDGNFTGIYNSPASLTIFRDKNGGGLPVFFSKTHFSNHIDGLRETLQSGLKPDLKSISFYLEHGYIPSPYTAFEGISKIPPGQYLICKEGACSLSNAFPFSDFARPFQNQNMSEQEAVDHYIQLHRNAIRRRIEGSTEVGVLLSGGYDSGGNLARLRDLHDGNIKSFSVGFKGNPWSELPYARLIARQYETEHCEYEIEGHEIEYLPEIVREFTEPFQESGLMLNLCVMKELISRQDVSTTLCGEGNDQLFGTAGRDLSLHYFFKKTGLNLFQKGFNSIFKNIVNLPGSSLYKMQFHNDKILHILTSDSFGFKEAERKRLFQEPLNSTSNESMYPNLFPYKNFEDLCLGKTYFLDLQQQTNEIIVYKAATSARLYRTSLEYPLLDLEIYRFITTLPLSYRLHGSLRDILRGKGISKYLYKSSLKGNLPERAVQRKKQGGFTPMVIFFRDETRRKDILDYIIRSDMSNNLMNSDVLVSYFNRFCDEIGNQKSWFWYNQFRCFQVFSLLILAIWWDQFINNVPYTKLSDFIGVQVK